MKKERSKKEELNQAKKPQQEEEQKQKKRRGGRKQRELAVSSLCGVKYLLSFGVHFKVEGPRALSLKRRRSLKPSGVCVLISDLVVVVVFRVEYGKVTHVHLV